MIVRLCFLQSGSAEVEIYRNLFDKYCYMPLGVETLGAWGLDAVKLITSIGKKVFDSSGESRAVEYLKERLSVET